jgi:iron complex outermembrane receptor protein
MRLLTLLLSLLLSYRLLQAQEVSGSTFDTQGKPLAGASVTLKRDKDSSVVKLGVSNIAGEYQLTAIPSGQYFVNISHIGYASRNSPVFRVEESGITRAPPATLSRITGTLKEAVITAGKPLIEVKADKIILHVEGSINSVGSDALEVLRKAPGVTVDKDNNLSLGGKNGVPVYVDGRPTYLAGADLAAYLKTIQSSSIESIEIISNPSARYDAAGNAGVVNIRLKKNKAFGTNGNVSGGYNIGIYGKYNGAVSFNHRDAHINVFGNYSYNHNLTETNANQLRTQLDTMFLLTTKLLTTTNSHNFKAGMDYFLNKKSTVGVIISGVLSDNQLQVTSSTPISYIPTGKIDKILQANNSTTGSHNNGNFNLNYRYADSSGHELDVDADYSLYRIRSDQLVPNNYFDSSGKNLLYSHIYNMLSPTDINIYTLKADYTENFLKGKLGFGGKFSYVTSRNDFEEYDLFNSVKVMDTLSSNDFNYKENINAVYATYNRTFKGWVVQAGLRVENSNIKGTSTEWRQSGSDYLLHDSVITRHYTDPFPSGSITYNRDPNKQWTLTYSRRIDRPVYQDLNPFLFKLDDYTYQKGNTQLRPQYTNSAGLTFMYKYKLTATLNYSHIRDLATTLTDTADRSKMVNFKQNLATQNVTSLDLSYPFQYKWYSVFANVNSFYSQYRADFGVGRVINLNVFNVTVFTQHSIRFGKGWTGELDQYFTSPNIWNATLRAHSLGSLDVGFSKTILKGNGTVKASVTDVFRTLDWYAASNFAGQYLVTAGSYESRMLKLFFTYRFGNKQVKAARQRNTGVEEENKRVN